MFIKQTYMEWNLNDFHFDQKYLATCLINDDLYLIHIDLTSDKYMENE